MRARGQALVELAVTLPVLLTIALAGAQFVRLASARSGLDAATAAAAAAAARAPNATVASAAASSAFNGVASGYALGAPALTLDAGGFQRGGTVTAVGRASLSLGFSDVPALAVAWQLRSTATARIDDWRSRSP